MTTITGSVGRSGMNRPQDVRAVQTLLNSVARDRGGPAQALAIDGLAWSKTIAAIERFQRLALGHKWPDGRVDPFGPTLLALEAAGGPSPAQPHADAQVMKAGFSIAASTGWTYRNMQSLSAGPGAASGIRGWLIADHHTTRQSLRISFDGFGASLGLTPAAFSYAGSSFRSAGTQFFRGRRPDTGAAPHPFIDQACMIAITGATGGIGASGALLVFGCRPGIWNLILNNPALPLFQAINLLEALTYNSAWSFVAGHVVGLDAGVAAYVLRIDVAHVQYVPHRIAV
jgi:hypothetical protein